jgi:hypothetical protein
MQDRHDDARDDVTLQADGSIDAEALAARIFTGSPLSMPYPAAAHAAFLTASGCAKEVGETLDQLLDRCGIKAPLTAETLDAGLRAVQLAARGFDALRMASLRAALAERLKALKVGRPMQLLDIAFPVATAASARKAPKAMIVPGTEPWPIPVSGAEALDAVLVIVMRYIVITKTAGVALALWILHSYLMDAWQHSPILAVVSPVKRCGKSTLLSMSQALVYRPLICANTTSAVLFRLIEAEQPTLLLDEADTWLTNEQSELRGIVNSGHTRTTAVVARCSGDEHVVTPFSPWAAKLIAMIGRPPETILDRSIVIPMRRKSRAETTRPLRSRALELEARPIRQHLRRWADDYSAVLAEAEPTLPEALNDRQADCWRPLLALADALGGAWPTMARDAALDLSGQDDAAADDTLAVQLLSDIRQAFGDAKDPDVLDTATLLAKLAEMGERPWAEYRHGKPLNAHTLSRLLRGFEIFPAGKVRQGSKTVRAYRRNAFADAWSRYVSLPPGTEVEQRNRVNESGPQLPVCEVEQNTECSTSQSGTFSMDTGVCSTVPLSSPQYRPGEPFSVSEAEDERF